MMRRVVGPGGHFHGQDLARLQPQDVHAEHVLPNSRKRVPAFHDLSHVAQGLEVRQGSRRRTHRPPARRFHMDTPGRPAVVFMAYHGGPRDRIHERIGIFRAYRRSDGRSYTGGEAAQSDSRRAVRDGTTHPRAVRAPELGHSPRITPLRAELLTPPAASLIAALPLEPVPRCDDSARASGSLSLQDEPTSQSRGQPRASETLQLAC